MKLTVPFLDALSDLATRVTFGAVLSTLDDWLLPPPPPPLPPPDCALAMLNVRETVAPTLPALSIGRTTTVCAPAPRPVNTLGLVQAAKAPPSRLHWKPAMSPSGLENAMVAPLPLTSAELIVAVGAVLSTV
jgi:hypothetical protein